MLTIRLKNTSSNTKKKSQLLKSYRTISNILPQSSANDFKIFNKLQSIPSNYTILLVHPIYMSEHNINTDLIPDLKDYIIYKKSIHLSYKAYLGLNYNISIFEKPLTYHQLSKRADTQGYKDFRLSSIKNKKNNMYTIVLKNIDKTKLKTLFTNPHYRTILNDNRLLEISKILLNDNSIMFLEAQLTQRFINNISKSILPDIQQLKKFLDSNVHPKDQQRFILTGGALLSIYGLRKATDIDIIISDTPNTKQTNNFNNIIKKNFISNTRKHKNWDAIYKPLKWKAVYKTFHKEWSASVDAKNINEVIHNPKYHFYFLGLKFILLDMEIYRRNIRNRPAATADIIAINNLMNKEIPLNPVSNKYIYIFDDEVIEKETDKLEYVKSVSYHLKARYGINYSLSKISRMIKFEY